LAEGGAPRRVLEIPDGLPYDPFRTSLYTRDELMSGWRPGRPGSSLDGRIERHVLDHGFRAPPTPEALAQRLHDHAIDIALAGFLSQEGEPRRVVGVMGSAATPRDDSWFLAAAETGWMLARAGFLVASGGGPGIMEAANLGAFLAAEDDPAVVGEAVDALARAPSYEADPDAYTAAAAAVRERHLPGGESLAIPTWFYPHEPVGQFASHVAKYFANSIREDGLLTIAASGIVYAPGRAGTTQELFQDAAQNAYNIRGQSPMVLLGREWWDGEPSIHAVLRAQAQRFGGYERLVALCGTPAEALAFIQENEPAEAIEALSGEPQDVLEFMRNERVRVR
jgi:predicted Rossmann-fold nucleotide-binding protein